MNVATDQISDRGILSLYIFESHLQYLFHIFEHVCHLFWALKKKVESPMQDQILIQFFPQEVFM